MDAIRQWATGICFAAGAAGLCRLISPGGNLGKMMQAGLSVFFLTVFLFPITDLSAFAPNSSLEYSKEKAEQISQQAQYQSEAAAMKTVEQAAKLQLNRFLSSQGIIPISSGIDIIQKDGYLQAKLQICLKEEDRKNEEWIVRNLSSEYLSLTIEYQKGEDENGSGNAEGKGSSEPVLGTAQANLEFTGSLSNFCCDRIDWNGVDFADHSVRV